MLKITCVCRDGEVSIDTSYIKGKWFFSNHVRDATKNQRKVELKEFSAQCVQDWIRSIKCAEQNATPDEPRRLAELYHLCDYLWEEADKARHLKKIKNVCNNDFDKIVNCLSVKLHPNLSFIADLYAKKINQGYKHRLNSIHSENMEVIFRSHRWTSKMKFKFLKASILRDGKRKTFKDLKRSADSKDAASQNKLGLLYLKGVHEKHINVQKNVEKAFEYFQKAAKQGNAEGQHNLACLYFDMENDEKAFKWLHKSATQGNAAAQNGLGYMYFSGFGTRKNLTTSFQWHHRAAEQKNPSAQNNLGIAYQYGLGTAIDHAKAYRCFSKAANQGNYAALNNKGYILLNGYGIKRDHKKAFDCFYKGAKLGIPASQKNLAKLYVNGVGVKANEKKAVKWYQRAAEGGDSEARIYLGFSYLDGIGVEKNPKRGFFWILEAAKAEDPFAQNALGYLYFIGKGTEMNYTKAFKWFRRSAEQGNESAKNNIAYLYFEGLGVKKNEKKGIKIFRKLALRGNDSCQNNLACIYLMNSPKVYANIESAFYWFRKSEEQGNTSAINNLGYAYMEGIGCKKNKHMAYYYLSNTQNRGNPASQNNLGCLYCLIGEHYQDYALQCLQKAASRGNVEALENLDYIYREWEVIEGSGFKEKKHRFKEPILKNPLPPDCLIYETDDGFVIEKAYSKIL